MFAVQGEDDSWVDVGSLGIEAATTPELVETADALAALDVQTLGGGVVDPSFLSPIVAPGKVMAIGPTTPITSAKPIPNLPRTRSCS